MVNDNLSINEKLDAILQKTESMEIFSPEEIAALRISNTFVAAFHGDPKTLLRMASVYERVEGLISITKAVGMALAFIVILWSNADRLREMMGMKP